MRDPGNEVGLRRLLQLHEKLPRSGKAKIKRSFRFLKDLNLGTTTLGVFSIVNNIVRDTVVWLRIFISRTCFGISHPKIPPLSSENKLVFHFANQ